MKSLLLLAPLLLMMTSLHAQTPTDTGTLTVERLFSAPDLAGVSVSNTQFAPDGQRLTYLRTRENDAHRRDLWLWSAEHGAQLLLSSDALGNRDSQLSEAEKARRERLRLYAQGITSYQWHPKEERLLLPIGGAAFEYDPQTQKLDALDAMGEDVSEAHYSPQGRYISYVQQQNLMLYDQQKKQVRALTLDGGGAVSNGVAEFIAQEELDRFSGYWWADNEQFIAFARVDETPVQIAQRYDINADNIVISEQRYPRAGTANAQVQLAIVDMLDGHVSWIDLGSDDFYLARAQWLPDNRTLAVQRLSRDQKTLDLLFVDAYTRRVRTVLSEHSNTWINLNHGLRFLKKAQQFLWLSERNGYRHVYLYGNDGKLQKQLTDGAFVVSDVLAVNEEKAEVFVAANADTVLESHLYTVSLTGGALKRVSETGFWHDIARVNKEATLFADAYSSPQQPPALRVLDDQGNVKGIVHANAVESGHPWHAYAQQAVTPEFGTLKAIDGQTLHYRMYKPAQMVEGKRYPVIVHIYGGPHGQLVTREWDVPFHQLLAQQGFVVFTLDNRGMDNRGVAFESPIYRHMGEVEIRDQQTGVAYLRSLPFVDGRHIGMFGWSYGGYMTVMALAKAPLDFAAGVAVAPVSDFRDYDTAYTERYLGTPQHDAAAYQQSSVWPFLPQLKGHLLLVHGMADDNVLFTHSTRLMQALQKQNTPFELMTYPGAKHSIFDPQQRTHLYSLIVDFFHRQLGEQDNSLDHEGAGQ